MDVGRAAGREPLDPAPSPDRPRPERPRARRPTAPRTALRPSPPDPPRPKPHLAATTRKPPAAHRAHQDPRTRRRGLSARPSPTTQDLGDLEPGDTGNAGMPATGNAHTSPQNQDRAPSSGTTRGSGSDWPASSNALLGSACRSPSRSSAQHACGVRKRAAGGCGCRGPDWPYRRPAAATASGHATSYDAQRRWSRTCDDTV